MQNYFSVQGQILGKGSLVIGKDIAADLVNITGVIKGLEAVKFFAKTVHISSASSISTLSSLLEIGSGGSFGDRNSGASHGGSGGGNGGVTGFAYGSYLQPSLPGSVGKSLRSMLIFFILILFKQIFTFMNL